MKSLNGNHQIVWDIETDGLDPKVIHLLVAKIVGQEGYYIFRDKEKFGEFYSYHEGSEYIGHNSISFDSWVLSKLWGISIPVHLQTDTLVLSRLSDPTMDGHSLDRWGERLGERKLEFKDFSEYSEEMKVYCKQDVKVTERLYLHLVKQMKKFSPKSIRLEHSVQYIIQEQVRNGFLLDKEVAMKIYTEAMTEANRIEEAISKYFPPIVTERYSEKTGKKLKDSVEVFNLGSPLQIVKRLDELGWKPKVPTKTGKSWKICPENLNTIPDLMPDGSQMPECVKDLKKWKVLETRWKTAKDWLDRRDGDGRVHGQVILPGALTHRATHQNPNMANIPSITTERGLSGLFAYECREAWTVPRGSKLVGTDAAGIQLRVLAHYMNDPEYTKTLLEGDIHTFNQKALGEHCKDRPTAKTFIYAWLLGAGQGKVAEILGCSVRQAGEAMDNFLRSIPALKELKRKAGMAAQRGYLVGLDGRRISIESEHKSLSVYLQGGETVIMRLANVFWYNHAKKDKINFKQVVWVHDEWQTEVEETRADELGRLQVQAIKDTGEYFKMNCPLDGEYKVGKNWAETH
jgi:DNA polymerase-1